MSKVTFFLNSVTWRAFRMACLARHTDASKELRRFVEQQLAAWQQQPQKEPDRA